MKSIVEAGVVRGKYVLVRSSCNVPVVDGVVQNVYRLKRALPTLTYLRDQGARIIMIAHIGRDQDDTLRPVLTALETLIPITWGGSIGTDEFTTARNAMQDGDIILAENVRQDPREVANDAAFAALLALQADMYVNDAFDNIHRDHASMLTVPKILPAYAGLTLIDEVTHLQKAMSPVKRRSG